VKASKRRRSPARPKRAAVLAPRRIEIRGSLDRRAAEGLELEIRRLAQRHGVVIKQIRIEPAR
jgi:hypothetical protein